MPDACTFAALAVLLAVVMVGIREAAAQTRCPECGARTVPRPHPAGGKECRTCGHTWWE